MRFLGKHASWVPSTLACLLLVGAAALPTGEEQNKVLAQAVRRPPAPDFEGIVDWINTDKQLTLADLRGRIVLLDFWTLC